MKQTLAWHHNVWDLMPEASCSLELSERVQTEQRGPKETEEAMALSSSKDASTFSASTESVIHPSDQELVQTNKS